jgi:hypothetical protein
MIPGVKAGRGGGSELGWSEVRIGDNPQSGWLLGG